MKEGKKDKKDKSCTKRIVVMGATSGIGREVAEAFASRGWRVGAAARNVDRLVTLRNKYPANIVILPIDITDNNASGKLMRLIDINGGMDIYFHSSGILRDDLSLDETDSIATIDINVVGFTRMISAAYRYFRDNGLPGRIAAISSVAGVRGLGRLPAYSASKMYDRSFLQALQQLTVIDGSHLHITDIRPGWLRTPLLNPDRKYIFESDLKHTLPKILRAIVSGRRYVTIGMRWRILTTLEHCVPARLWSRLSIPLWHDR